MARTWGATWLQSAGTSQESPDSDGLPPKQVETPKAPILSGSLLIRMSR